MSKDKMNGCCYKKSHATMSSVSFYVHFTFQSIDGVERKFNAILSNCFS